MADLLVTGTVAWTEDRESGQVSVGPTGWELSFSGDEATAREYALTEIRRRYPRAVAIDVKDVEDLVAAIERGHPRKDR